jgi:hypothetical protein
MAATHLALTDFDSTDGGSGAPAVVLDPLGGIDGTSVRYTARATPGDRRLLVPNAAAGVTRGVLRGQMRVATRRSVESVIMMYGLSIAHSTADVTVAGTACYTLSLYRQEGGSPVSHRLTLRKHGAGLSSNGFELAYYAFAETTAVVTMQLIWEQSAAAAYFEAFTGAAVDYSDLVSRFTWIDQSSPLTTSAAEGMFWRTPDNASVYDVWMDNLAVDELL